jgi:hypothetical protein
MTHKQKHKIYLMDTPYIRSFLKVSGPGKLELHDRTAVTDEKNLYIVSDDKPEAGDHVVIVTSRGNPAAVRELESVDERYAVTTTNNAIFLSHVKKIIATTDKRLYTKKPIPGAPGHFVNTPIPGIDKQYVRYFVDQFNNDNIMTEVAVEYGNKPESEPYFSWPERSNASNSTYIPELIVDGNGNVVTHVIDIISTQVTNWLKTLNPAFLTHYFAALGYKVEKV